MLASPPALWFQQHRVKTFPVVSKVPRVSGWQTYEQTDAQAASLIDYAVVLGVLAVIDTDNDEAEAWVSANCPATPFVVKTARGLHRYYRLVAPDSTPHYIHRNGLTIEFRHRGQYVIGPGSHHASGHVYTANEWSWDYKSIPWFPVDTFEWDDRPAGERGSASGVGETYQLPDKIYAGERHDQMFRMLRSLRMRGVSLEGCLEACRYENKHHCEPELPWPATQRYLRRVFHHANVKGYSIRPLPPWKVFDNTIDVGFSVEAALAAAASRARDLGEEFDPLNSPAFNPTAATETDKPPVVTSAATTQRRVITAAPQRTTTPVQERAS